MWMTYTVYVDMREIIRLSGTFPKTLLVGQKIGLRGMEGYPNLSQSAYKYTHATLSYLKIMFS
jgi:hypothetical protein